MLRKFAQVVVYSPLGVSKSLRDDMLPAKSLRERAFTYSIPDRLVETIAAGQLVWVPFGSRRIQGVIVGLGDSSPVEQTKDVDEVVEQRPLLSSIQIDLADWIARTYLCSFYDAIRLMLPPGIEQPTKIYLSLASDAPRDQLGAKQAALIKWLADGQRKKLSAVPRDLRSSVDALVRMGIIIKQTISPARSTQAHQVGSADF
jgi:primosomal protein N' (replication factor Y)